MIDRVSPRASDNERSKLQLTSLAEIAKLVNASSDLGTMLDRIVLAICRYTMWDMSSIMSVDESAGKTVLMARYDPHFMDVPSAPRTWDLSSSPALKVMQTGEPVFLLDAQTIPTIRSIGPTRVRESIRPSSSSRCRRKTRSIGRW
jgi:hypothetical protein